MIHFGSSKLGARDSEPLSFQFLAELLLCYLTGNIFGVEDADADDVQMMCGWHESEISGEISLEDNICRLHVVRMMCEELCKKPTGLLVSIFMQFSDENSQNNVLASLPLGLVHWICINHIERCDKISTPMCVVCVSFQYVKKIKYNWYNNNDNPMGKEAKRTVCIWTFLPNKYTQGTYNYHDWKCLLPCLYKTQTPDLTKLATCNKILT